MCEEYIGVKMMATGELKNYQQSHYRTVEEKSQSRNLFAAWVAVFISVISVFIGNILPLSQKSDAEYLNDISQKISSVEERLEKDTVAQDILCELTELNELVTELTEKITQPSYENWTSTIEELTAQVEELSRILTQNTNHAQ